jgi:hypothetical protein
MASKRIAEKLNDPTFNPFTAISDCHYNFLPQLTLGMTVSSIFGQQLLGILKIA